MLSKFVYGVRPGGEGRSEGLRTSTAWESFTYDDVAKLDSRLQIGCIGHLLCAVGLPSALGPKSETVDD